MLCWSHSPDIQELPLDGGQVLNPVQADQLPLRSTFLDRNDKLPLRKGQVACDSGHQRFSRFFQLLAGHFFLSHVPEFGLEDRPDIGESRIEKLHHRPVVADQVNDKGLAQGVVEGPVAE